MAEQMNTPLGRYGPIVAAVVCVGAIGAFIFATIFGHILGMDAADVNSLKELAILAFGFVSGTAVGVNGWKREVSAIHHRLDESSIPAADQA